MQLFRGKKKTDTQAFADIFFARKGFYLPFPSSGESDVQIRLGDVVKYDKSSGLYVKTGNIVDLVSDEKSVQVAKELIEVPDPAHLTSSEADNITPMCYLAKGSIQPEVIDEEEYVLRYVVVLGC